MQRTEGGALKGGLKVGGFILMGSTIGSIDAGMVAVLEEALEKETGIRVRHVGAGTGEALKIAAATQGQKGRGTARRAPLSFTFIFCKDIVFK